jgi:hypothetical protein
VDLLSYQLLYTIDQFRLPLPSEFETVGDLTKAFVNSYFGTLYPTQLVAAETDLVDANFNFGAPVDMLYNTTLVFTPGSEYPMDDQLNSELEAAFTGDSLASYLAIIQGLPPSNIFETTSLVEFQRPNTTSPMSDDISGQGSTSSVASTASPGDGFFSKPIVQYTGIAVGAGAACFIIIVTGLLLQDRKRVSSSSRSRKQGDGGNRNGGRPPSVTGHTIELASSNDSRGSATPLYSGSTTAALALDHQHSQRSITMPQEQQQLSRLGSTDSAEWEEIVQARHHIHHIGSVCDEDDEDDEAEDDDAAVHLTEHHLLHDVNLSSSST